MSALRKLLLLATCLAFAVIRVGGAHLHICMDGSEAPSAVHFADSGLHHAGDAPAANAHDHGKGSHHHDAEVSLASDVITKVPSLDLPVIAGLLFIVLASVQWLRVPLPDAPIDFRIPRSPFRLRPPLRGPPLHSFA